MQFLDVIESIKTEEASISRLFGGEGKGVRGRKKTPEYLASVAEAAQFVAEVYAGTRPTYHLQEALSTDDFPQLFGDVIDRMLLANYRETDVTYTNYIHTATVADFRTVKRFAIDGSESVLDEVDQQAPYPQSNLSDTEYSYAVKKYGRAIPFSWETIVNDDLGAFRDIVERMGKAARRSEEKFATQLFVDSTGPDATFFSVGNKNLVTTNPLTIAGLQAAITKFLNQVDTEGEPISVGAMQLVVPPALKVTAMNIMNALEIRALTGGGGDATQGLVAVNWVKGELTLQVNSYLPIVDTTTGATSWYLFANPNDGRPAAEFGKLRGHEEPEVFIKSPNQSRAGGGGEDPMNGDFDNDSIAYKVRHVFGGVLMDPKSAVANTI